MRTVGSRAHSRLSRTGKPMRALRALENTDSTNSMTADDVWRIAGDGLLNTSTWHGPLYVLVDHGLARRIGRRWSYRWHITEDGRELLEQLDGETS